MKKQSKKVALPVLTEAEQTSLTFMAEEEKLAQDVYTALADIWGVSIFNNIANSESKHVNSVIQLASKYNISSDLLPAGEFTNPELQALYDSLVAIGSQSLTDALKVGVTIEVVDIEDLETALATTSNANMISTYDKLLSGSENHLASFSKLLTQNGDSLAPEAVMDWLTVEMTELTLAGQATPETTVI
jgi:hypothetical protein